MFLVLLPEKNLVICFIGVYVKADSSEVLRHFLAIWALCFQGRYSQGMLIDC
jgi:hypothetical protein